MTIATEFVNPLGRVTHWITQDHGELNTEIVPGQNRWHLGVDLSAGAGDSDLGTRIDSAANGVVVFAGQGGAGWGGVVIIQHELSDGSFISTVYGHIDPISVSVGDTVAAGQQIGSMGNAGGLYAAHLHFEVFLGKLDTPGAGYTQDGPDPDPINSGWIDPVHFRDNLADYIPEVAAASAGQADVAITSFAVSDTTIEVGETLDFTWTVTNLGDVETPDAGGTALVVSTDQVASLDTDTIIGVQTFSKLAAGASETESEEGITLPVEFGPGSYWVFAVAADGGADPNEFNNFSALTEIVVSAGSGNSSGSSGVADVTVTDFEVSATSIAMDETLDFAWTVANIGTGQTRDLEGSVLYISRDATVSVETDTVLHVETFRSLQAGEIDDEAQAGVSLPAGFGPGSYWVYAAAADGSVDPDTDNNVSDVVQITVTGASTNAAPVATVEDQSVAPGEWVRLSDVLSYSDADGDALAQIALWDDAGGDNWWADGGIVDASAGYQTTDLSDVWFKGDATAGSQTLWVAANDGTEWGAWDGFTLETAAAPNTAPVASVADQSVAPGEWVRLSDVLSYSDADGDALATISLWDDAGIDNWWADGGIVDASSGYETSALSDVWFKGDATAGSQTLWIQASDGTDTSAWDAFTLETAAPANRAPVAEVEDQSVAANAWVRLTDVFEFADADGDALAELALWDDAGIDNWWADGGIVDASSGYETSDLSGVWFKGDPSAGAQTLWVQANDGTEWGAWEDFVLTTL